MELQIQSLKIKFKVVIDMSSAIYLANCKARSADAMKVSGRSVQFKSLENLTYHFRKPPVALDD